MWACKLTWGLQDRHTRFERHVWTRVYSGECCLSTAVCHVSPWCAMLWTTENPGCLTVHAVAQLHFHLHPSTPQSVPTTECMYKRLLKPQNSRGATEQWSHFSQLPVLRRQLLPLGSTAQMTHPPPDHQQQLVPLHAAACCCNAASIAWMPLLLGCWWCQGGVWG
jgi:hypothetical protein